MLLVINGIILSDIGQEMNVLFGTNKTANLRIKPFEFHFMVPKTITLQFLPHQKSVGTRSQGYSVSPFHIAAAAKQKWPFLNFKRELCYFLF